MDYTTTREEIADAAIEFIEARTRAAELKRERATLLSSEDCAHDKDVACFAKSRPSHACCDRCLRAQAAHRQYKTALGRRSSSLVKLKRVVEKRERSQAVNA